MARRTVQNFSAINQSQIKRAEKQEDTRSFIANVFVIGYLIAVAVLILLATFADLSSDNVKDFLLAIGSPLGFIIGFYFKSSSET